ncbi:hypothetical protein ACP70R_011975 [Stipagrostis hirtigluma subsp. patula]
MPTRGAEKMREELIRLCSDAEAKLEEHYSDMLNAFDSPLDHLSLFPYFSNYVNLSKLEYELLVRHMRPRPRALPCRVRRVGPDDEVINSVIVTRKVDAGANGLMNGHRHVLGAVPLLSTPCKTEVNVLQKSEEMAKEELAF